MPQMSPIYWLLMMMYFIIMLMMMIMFVYFFFYNIPSMNIIQFNKNKSLGWLW